MLLDWDGFFRAKPYGNKLDAVKEQSIMDMGEECLAQYLPTKWDDKCRRQIAYVITTAGWETNLSFQPVEEAYWITPRSKRHQVLTNFYTTGKGRNHQKTIIKKVNGNTVLYIGRGYVQLTHDYNYKEFSQYLFKDDSLYNDPDMALDTDIAMDILVGWFYWKHSVKFNTYVSDNSWDLKKLRSIVNGTDKWDVIASQAKVNYNALNWSKAIPTFESVSLYDRLKLSLNNLHNLQKLYL